MNISFSEEYRKNKEVIDRYIPPEVIARLQGQQDEALKHRYNRLLKRESELVATMEYENISPHLLNETLIKHKKVTAALSKILKELDNMGVEVTDIQVESGF